MPHYLLVVHMWCSEPLVTWHSFHLLTCPTLEDVLGFVPKVDFNAGGVVAAGEAQIESTVTGNDSISSTNDISLGESSRMSRVKTRRAG